MAYLRVCRKRYAEAYGAAHLLSKQGLDVLGLVLGIMFEREVRMALQTSHNDWTIFLTRPVACVFVVLSVLFVANSLWKAWKDSKAEKAKAQA